MNGLAFVWTESSSVCEEFYLNWVRLLRKDPCYRPHWTNFTVKVGYFSQIIAPGSYNLN